MRAKFFLTNPMDREFTIQMTMPLKEWVALRDQLQVGKWPSSQMSGAINEVVSAGQKFFEPRVPDE